MLPRTTDLEQAGEIRPADDHTLRRTHNLDRRRMTSSTLR